ncbi:MAG: 1-acyl-sn-glycerol-3-phosphate acyltransferase, partial [Alphaproteobacteria bacterium]
LPSLTIQPVTVTYAKVHGVPMGRYYRPFFAWYGDMEMAPHLWAAFGLGPIDVIVTYHEPLTLKEAGNRKKLARQAEQRTRMGMVKALHRAT